ncbi:hypothetical protein KA977_11970 [Candidatus Dependentiae bacterium]|nr:hypothetical protein [Candidatus Dependentiae bacterium]
MNLDYYNQQTAVNFLKNSITQKRLAHAYIFSGQEGLGKLFIARYFINLIQCLNSERTLEPCGICKNCNKIKQDIFVDNLEITCPDDKTTISVDQIREEILEFAKYSANEGKYKVCLIYPVEKMRAEAMNALLKILEEPPEKFIFLLVTANHFQLLPTILSRCQIIKFKPLPVKQIENRLMKYNNIDPVKSKILSVLSGGRINFALKLNETDALEKRQNILNGLTLCLEKKTFFDTYNYVNSVASEVKVKKEKTEDDSELKIDKNKISVMFIEIIGSFFRDLMYYKSFKETGSIMNVDFLEEIIKLSEYYNFFELEKFLYNCFESEKLLKSNVNPLLVFSNMLVE